VLIHRRFLQSTDFQTIDAYVTSQMQSMHIPGVALGIVQGDAQRTKRPKHWTLRTNTRFDC